MNRPQAQPWLQGLVKPRKRWLTVALPLGALALLVAIAPPLPQGRPKTADLRADATTQAFRYRPDDEAFTLDFDPRKVQLDLLEGWDREQDAYQDTAALAYVSGPMYERHVNNSGQEITVPLGDIKLGSRVWRGRNRTAARQRAFIGIRHDGHVDFGYGELTPARAHTYDAFIGGLHSIYNDLEQPPAAYKGAYSISMGQQIRYYLPRIRMVIGLRPDGRLEVLMSRDGLTLEQTRSLARQHGLLAAYLPDHASKSRFIIPGIKGFSDADANWISGGATSFVHVPYLLRLSSRSAPLQGNLLSSLSPHLGSNGCANPLACGQTLGGQLLDRALAGLNRLMDEGVEPLARLIWAPKGPRDAERKNLRSPLREPPITADPLALRELQRNPIEVTPSRGDLLPLPPDLPPPLVLDSGETLPEGEDGGQPVDRDGSEPTDPGVVSPEPSKLEEPGQTSEPEAVPALPNRGPIQAPANNAAPPAPVLPPPALP